MKNKSKCEICEFIHKRKKCPFLKEGYCTNGENDFDSLCSCEACPIYGHIFDKKCWKVDVF